jgi:glycosyltransferase involved in cell wall biosynthesis
VSNNKSAECPRVSVLMTIYNAEHYLQSAIDSLVNQSYGNWELIVIENGSSDNSLAILSSYSDSRIRVCVLDSNIGRTKALRLAFEKATGEYIAVLDADDVSYPERFSSQLSFLDSNPHVALVATWGEYINAVGKKTGSFKPSSAAKDLIESLAWTNPIAHSSVMYRKLIAQELGGYPLTFVWGQDLGLFLAIASRYPIAMIDRVLCQIRIQQNSMTLDRENMFLVAKERLDLLMLSGRIMNFSKKARCINHGAITFAELKIGIALFHLKHYFDCVDRLARALARNPRCLIIYLNLKLLLKLNAVTEK